MNKNKGQRCETVSIIEKDQMIPCQLGKVSNRPCTMMCAFEHGCPVMYIDSHDFPIVRRTNPEDLEAKP